MAPPAAMDSRPSAAPSGAAPDAFGAASCAGTLALLREPHAALVAAAIQRLSPLVPQFWHEISAPDADHLAVLEGLLAGGNKDSPLELSEADRQLAALVLSRVYFYLEEWDRSLQFALAAGELFTDLIKRAEGSGADAGGDAQMQDASLDLATLQYVDTLMARFVGEYVKQKQAQFSAQKSGSKAAAAADADADLYADEAAAAAPGAGDDAPAGPGVDARLERVVDSMFERSFQAQRLKEALGIAIECRRLDYIKRAIGSGDNVPAMLEYAQKCALDFVTDREFRQHMLETIVEVYRAAAKEGKPVNSLRICACLVLLDDADGVAGVVAGLLTSGVGGSADEKTARNHQDTLAAFQIAFDLADSATQQFRLRVASAVSAAHSGAGATPTMADVVKSIVDILHGDVTIRLHLNFLARHNKADLLVLNQLKAAVEQPRNAVLHSAVVIANALMHAGTTSDKFLRDNLKWLAMANNWAKFSAVAGLGVINKGHLGQAQKLLGPYLPGAAGGAGASAYQEGGALYALGLIHANHGNPEASNAASGDGIVSMMLTNLAAAAGNEIVQHGACLGLGLTAMATRDQAVYDALRDVLLSDSAVAGEAAGIAMGLVMCGSPAQSDGGYDPSIGEKIEEMLAYARDTQHEKIIRGVSLGVALCVYGQESAADSVIETMLREQDPIIRFGGVWAMALAYAGAGAHSGVLQRLLHVAVSAVTDDERRAATTALGFVLHREARDSASRSGSAASGSSDDAAAEAFAGVSATGDSSLLPSLVRTLSASFNPHVRYGAAMALGVGFAGTGDAEALNMLKPMAESDRVDFVRQGALEAGAMVCIQCNDPLQSVKEPSGSDAVTAGAKAAAIAAAGGPARLASELLQEQRLAGAPLSVAEDPKKIAAEKAAAAAAEAAKAAATAAATGDAEMKDADKKDGEKKSMIKDDKKKDKEERPKPKSPQEEEAAALKKIKSAQRPIAAFRQLMHDKAHDKREELLCKFGAVVAHGIADGGGRNATVSLSPISSSGATANNRAAVCGMALFLQSWFWHPFSHMLSLAMHPTTVIAVDGTLKPPTDFEFDCAGPEQVFAYPPPRVAEKKTKAKKVNKAVLSTTRKHDQREKEKSGGKEEEAADDKAGADDATMEDASAEASGAADDKAAEHTLTNPSRVTLTQVPLLRFRSGDDDRWRPIHAHYAESAATSDANSVAGIVLLRNAKPDAADEISYIDTDADKAAAAANADEVEEEDEGDEPEPPAPFVFDPALED